MPDDHSDDPQFQPGGLFGDPLPEPEPEPPPEPWLTKPVDRDLQARFLTAIISGVAIKLRTAVDLEQDISDFATIWAMRGFNPNWIKATLPDLIPMKPEDVKAWQDARLTEMVEFQKEAALTGSKVYQEAIRAGASPVEALRAVAFAASSTALGAVPKREAALAHYVVTSGLANFEAYLQDDFQIDGLLPRRGFGALYGAPGCGKSILALAMALHIATGHHFAGADVKQGAVLYAALEGAKSFTNRAIAAVDANGLDMHEAAKRFHLMRKVNLDLQSTDQDQRGILEVVQHLNATAEAENEPPISLIIVDTLNRVFGGGDENSGQDMGRLIGHCMALQEEAGAFVLLIHHSGKDVAKGLRGHSSLLGAIDLELRVDVPKSDDGTEDTSAKRRTLTASKVRDGEDGVSFDFDIRSVPVGVMNEGTPLAKTKYSAAAVAVTVLGRGTKKPIVGRKPTAQAAFMNFIKETIAQTNWTKKTPVGPGFPETPVLCVPETVVLKHYEDEFEATMPMTEDEPHAKRAARRKRFARDKVRNAMEALKGKVMKAADPDGKAYLWVAKDPKGHNWMDGMVRVKKW
jgi:hypothetical protein